MVYKCPVCGGGGRCFSPLDCQTGGVECHACGGKGFVVTENLRLDAHPLAKLGRPRFRFSPWTWNGNSYDCRITLEFPMEEP